MEDSSFHEIADLCLRKSGQAFRPSQAYLVESRLSQIIRREGFSTLAELAQCLTARPNRVLEEEVVAELAGKRSHFFLDRATLGNIVDTVLPGAADRTEAQRLRLLCAGGAGGQEAYSLAMLIDEAGEAAFNCKPVDIISIDHSKTLTERGRAGVFSHFQAQNGLSISRLLSNFERRDNGDWQASEALRSKIGFRTHNLMEDLTGLGHFDVIVCRNTINTMAPPMAREVCNRLTAQLTPRGMLFFGPDEALPIDDALPLRPSTTVPGAYVRRLHQNAGAAIAAA